MKEKLYTSLASCLFILALAIVAPATVATPHGGPHQQNHQKATKRPPDRVKAEKKASRREVIYTCPMHPDIREKSRGACPKCMMNLEAEPRQAGNGSGDMSEIIEMLLLFAPFHF